MNNEKEIENIQHSEEKPIAPFNNEQVRNEGKSKWHWFQVSCVCAIRFCLSMIAGYLVWECNNKENIIFKILLTLVAMSFSEIYILYYAFYRVFLGNKCY
tara:strand:+ start:3637 stop:3936 length:300 start_codon:yes stop_codon:yes gene_type:complete